MMREQIEQATDGPCVFLLGACGDLGPREGFVGDVAVADRNGRQLAYAALSALETVPGPGTKFSYAGPVVSGATIGVWRHDRLSPNDLEATSVWRRERWTVELPYRSGLPTSRETQAELDHWLQMEKQAGDAGELLAGRDARAMVERMTRQKTRLAALPEGRNYPYQVVLWRIGNAFWVGVEGEPYNLLQRALRERFAGVPIIVMVLSDGWRPTYLPTVETYGHGIYQGSIAVLEPGCLEKLIGAIGDRIAEWMA
jgi:hypothetical protein